MSGPFEERLVRIPFRFKDDKFWYFSGGPLPKMRDGTYGEMVVDRSALTNSKDVERLNEKKSTFFLKRGTLVLLRIRPTEQEDYRLHLLLSPKTIVIKGSHDYFFAEVVLDETLELLFRGSKPPRLCPCPCQCPKLKIRAQSLNHAYTQVSELFQPNRLSHAGNIFRDGFVFHQGKDEWISLNDVRGERQELYEERLSCRGAAPGTGNESRG